MHSAVTIPVPMSMKQARRMFMCVLRTKIRLCCKLRGEQLVEAEHGDGFLGAAAQVMGAGWVFGNQPGGASCRRVGEAGVSELRGDCWLRVVEAAGGAARVGAVFAPEQVAGSRFAEHGF